MTVAANDRLTPFLGDGVTLNFNYDFPVSSIEEIEVFVDGELVSYPDGYSITLGSSLISFAIAPANGALGAIVSKRGIVQDIAYSRQNNSVSLEALTEQLDDIVYKLQEVSRDVDKSVKTDYYTNPPRVVGEFTEGKVPITDENGNFIPGLDGGNIASAESYAIAAQVAQVAAELARDQAIDAAASVGVYRVARYAHLAIGKDWTIPVQTALAAIPQGGLLSFEGVPTGIEIYEPCIRAGWSGVVDGCGITIVNMFDRTDYPRGTAGSIFQFSGSAAAEGTLGTEATRGATTITIATGDFAEGDEISFDVHFIGGKRENISRIRSIVGTTATLDRAIIATVPNGGTIYKRTPVRVTAGNFYFDFNGSVDEPRYGYGVIIYDGADCLTHSIDSDRAGSKVAVLAGCVDSDLYRVKGRNGTDVGGTGGHSYVTRLQVSNDCRVIECVGSFMRHTGDLSGASRNTFINCRDMNGWSAAFLTHGNNCVDNLFINCEVYENTTAAFAFSAGNGDLYNTIIGGYVRNTIVIYNDAGPTNIAIGTYVTTTTGNVRAPIGIGEVDDERRFVSCVFDLASPMIVSSGTGGSHRIVFDNPRFVARSLRSLASLSTAGNALQVEMNNPIFEVPTHAGNLFEGNAGVTLEMLNPVLRADVVAGFTNSPCA